MNTSPSGWKKTYWPEPRMGQKETRQDVLRRLGKPTSHSGNHASGPDKATQALEVLKAMLASAQ